MAPPSVFKPAPSDASNPRSPQATDSRERRRAVRHGLRTAEPGWLGEPAGLCVLRIAGGPLSDRRRRAPRARPDRLRRLHVGHPRFALLGSGIAPAEFFDGSAGARRHLRRRKEALSVLDRIDRPIPPQRGVRLFHVYRGHHRRRRGRGLPPRRGGTQHPRAADPIGRFSRHQEGRLPRRLRRPGQAHRQRLDRRNWCPEHQHPRRFQPGGRNVDDPRLLPAHRRRSGGHAHRRRPRRVDPPRRTAPASTSCNVPDR